MFPCFFGICYLIASLQRRYLKKTPASFVRFPPGGPDNLDFRTLDFWESCTRHPFCICSFARFFRFDASSPCTLHVYLIFRYCNRCVSVIIIFCCRLWSWWMEKNETGQLALDLHEALEEDDDAIERWLEYSQQFLVKNLWGWVGQTIQNSVGQILLMEILHDLGCIRPCK